MQRRIPTIPAGARRQTPGSLKQRLLAVLWPTAGGGRAGRLPRLAGCTSPCRPDATHTHTHRHTRGVYLRSLPATSRERPHR